MKFTYTCKKVSLNDSIKEYTEKKVSKLDRYFQEEPAAFVTFSVEKNHLCTVELTIRGGNTIFRAQTQETDGDMRSAVDAAISYIERQILKNKTRLSKRMRSEAFPAPAEMDDFSVAEEKEFDIVRASDGEEAVKICRELKPAAILMDVKMPGMDGLEATRQIRTFDPSVPIVAVTAFAYDRDRQRALDAGCNEYLAKPLTGDKLKHTLHVLLSGE